MWPSLYFWAALVVLLLVVYKYRYRIPYVYGFTTAVSSFWVLYRMPQSKIQSFMDSYSVYNEEVLKDASHTQKIVDYYYVLNHLCATGSIEKMYLPPVIDPNAGIGRNQLLYEEKMVRDLQLKRGARVLDVGCGRGRVAAHVARLVPDSYVSGINVEASQVANGNYFAKMSGLGPRLQLKVSDFNEKFPFPDNTFDGLYQIQVMSLAKNGDFGPMVKEMWRVMKPGARLCFCDWVKLPAFDINNPKHKDLYERCKLLIGAVFTPSVKDFEDALTKQGFKIEISTIPSEGGHQYKMVEAANKYFMALWGIVKVLVALHILPAHFNILFDRFNKDGNTLTDGDRMKLWTTVYQFVAQKPAQ